MKKLYIILFSTCLISSLDAQVEIREYTGTGGIQVGNDISGTVFSVDVDQPGMLSRHFAVKNVFGTDQYFAIRRLRIDIPNDWTDQLSWGQDPDVYFEGACYSPNQMSSNPWTSGIATGTDHFPQIDNQNIGNLTIEINVQSNGTGLYRYYILTDPGAAPVDSVDLLINATTLGTFDQNRTLEIEIYPNPVNDILIINTTLKDDLVMKVTDLIGNEVYKEQITINHIDLSNYQKGAYLLSFYRKDELIQIQRIIIEH
jgi:nitrogen regulatory protein PII-like uncharacterized protein